ncbi:hypothetical protein [uncultured Limosilactobacillus sp.]|uniref:hypothetical protein n=1 Tax=uncultured Limosilactobacillus sp. TaxID=2837629 RepID=UPI0025F42F5C|nr:hypothetical protein [uncultured Limosilactobacillus sp.]
MNEKQMKELDAGRLLVQQGKYHQAVRQLTPLNEETGDFEVNRLLSLALQRDGQVQLAIKIAEDHVDDYLQSREGARQLILLETAGQQFITARRQAAFVPQWSQKLTGEISQAEKQAEVATATTLKARLKSFYHLGDGSFREQRQRLIEAEQLPLKMYLTGALFLLRDPFAKPLIKSSILETLQPLKIDQEATVLWIDDHEYQLNLCRLQPLTKVPEVATMQKMLDDQYGQSDPSTLAALTDELQLQMIFLYPFISKAVTSQRDWVTALTSFGTLVTPTESVERAQKWQQKIQRLVDQMR